MSENNPQRQRGVWSHKLFVELFLLTIRVCDQTPRDNPESRDLTPRAKRDQTPRITVENLRRGRRRRARVAAG
jgi:hypothetical protein